MSDALIDVPELPVRSDGMEHAAHELRGRAAAVPPAAEEAVAGWNDLRARYDAPEAPELVESMTLVVEGGNQTSEAFSRIGAVLGELADALRLLEKRRSAVFEEAAAGGSDIATGRAHIDLSIARLRSDIAAVLDDACRDLSGVAAPPPMSLASGGSVAPLVGPRITWQMRTEQAVLEIVLAPLIEAARGGAGRVRTMLATHPEFVERIRQRPPAPDAVRDWWNALPTGAKTALTHGAPAVVGALGGVPPLARVAANRVVARDRIAFVDRDIAQLESLLKEGAMATLRAERQTMLDRLAAERSYLDRVVAGDVQLVLYQPEANRIAEMIGTPGPGTQRVLTYVPGTFTSVHSFYGNAVQELPRWLSKGDTGMVAFVWKGTDFPGDGDRAGLADQVVGIGEANQQDRAVPAGESLARFANEMRTNPDVAAARQIGGGYSWGLVPLTGSELAGTHYDSVHSFAGAWVPRGWAADPRTDYSHWSYTDFLSIAQDLGWVGDGRNPDVTPEFEHHVFERPGDFDVPLGGDLAPFLDPNGPSVRISVSPMENHQLIVSTRPENLRAREAIYTEVVEGRK